MDSEKERPKEKHLHVIVYGNVCKMDNMEKRSLWLQFHPMNLLILVLCLIESCRGLSVSPRLAHRQGRSLKMTLAMRLPNTPSSSSLSSSPVVDAKTIELLLSINHGGSTTPTKARATPSSTISTTQTSNTPSPHFTPTNQSLLLAAKSKPTNHTPLWLFRQAGR